MVAALDRDDVRLKTKKLDLDTKHHDSPTSKPSIEEAPKMELKALAPHLKYVFLGKGYTFLVIIASYLNVEKVECFVEVLKRFDEPLV